MIPWIFRRERVSLNYSVTFTDSCRYEIDEPSCVNKLFGVTHGLFGVHKNSDRFGWTYNKETDKINIWIYYYDNGNLIKKIIDSVCIGERNAFKIYTDTERNLEFSINDNILKIHPQGPGKKWHVLLTPYFGGNSVAPHRIEIEMKRFK